MYDENQEVRYYGCCRREAGG